MLPFFAALWFVGWAFYVLGDITEEKKRRHEK
jgi:hypothetical protein